MYIETVPILGTRNVDPLPGCWDNHFALVCAERKRIVRVVAYWARANFQHVYVASFGCLVFVSRLELLKQFLQYLCSIILIICYNFAMS
jgi:hypothetical protein